MTNTLKTTWFKKCFGWCKSSIYLYVVLFTETDSGHSNKMFPGYALRKNNLIGPHDHSGNLFAIPMKSCVEYREALLTQKHVCTYLYNSTVYLYIVASRNHCNTVVNERTTNMLRGGKNGVPLIMPHPHKTWTCLRDVKKKTSNLPEAFFGGITLKQEKTTTTRRLREGKLGGFRNSLIHNWWLMYVPYTGNK